MRCSLISLWVPFHWERHMGEFNFAFGYYYFRSFHYIRFIVSQFHWGSCYSSLVLVQHTSFFSSLLFSLRPNNYHSSPPLFLELSFVHFICWVAKTQGIGEASHQFTCAGLSLSTGLMNALKTSKRMVNIFIPTACSSSQTSHLKFPLFYLTFVPTVPSGVSSSYITFALSGFELMQFCIFL